MSSFVDRIRHQFSDARPAKRAGLILLALAAFSVIGTSAWAYWTTHGIGSASASTGTINPPTDVRVLPATNHTGSVPVTWIPSADAGGLVPQGYYVTRTTGTTTDPACGSSPTSLVPGGATASACDDPNVPNATYTYRVIAVFHSWTAPSADSDSVYVQAPKKLAFTTQPSNTVGGTAITPDVAVTLQDDLNATVPVAGVSVTIAIGTNPASGVLSGTVTATTDAAGVATFSNLSIDNSGAGYTLSATSGALPEATSSTFDITKRSQSITFTSTAPTTATFDGSYTVAATASSGLTVVLTSATTAVCTVSGSSVTFVGVGTCAVNANQAGNANYSAATQAQQSFAVGQGAQAITFTSTAPSNASVGGSTYTVTATASSGLPVVLSVDGASTGCTLSGSTSGSTVSFTAVGTCKIDANQAGNANYSAATQAQQSFAVVSNVPSAPTGLTVRDDGSHKVTVSWTSISGLTYQCQITSSAAPALSTGWSTCTSSTQYNGQNGSHTFYVRAVNGVTPGTPASEAFTA